MKNRIHYVRYAKIKKILQNTFWQNVLNLKQLEKRLKYIKNEIKKRPLCFEKDKKKEMLNEQKED